MVKWKLALQLQYYRMLFLLGLKSQEIYYIGGSEALPPPLDEGRGGVFAAAAVQRRCGRPGYAD